ncbi:hypothetical protein [Streptomyces sp. NPDC059894]|uniref:hypothetical protein n=1 Tax=unclassified Streptomyces TaxID=2593676 RepID=UPI003653A5A1
MTAGPPGAWCLDQGSDHGVQPGEFFIAQVVEKSSFCSASAGRVLAGQDQDWTAGIWTA